MTLTFCDIYRDTGHVIDSTFAMVNPLCGQSNVASLPCVHNSMMISLAQSYMGKDAVTEKREEWGHSI